MLIVSGDVSPGTGLKFVNTNSKKKCSLAFANANWGKKVRKWVAGTQCLSLEQWSRIQNRAVDHLAAMLGDNGEGCCSGSEGKHAGNHESSDPCLMIGLDD